MNIPSTSISDRYMQYFMKFISALLILSLFSNCSGRAKSIYILLDRKDNLVENSIIYHEETKIGHVENLEKFQTKYVAKIILDPGVNVPTDSKFSLHKEFFKPSWISINYSDKSTFLFENDTVVGDLKYPKGFDKLFGDSALQREIGHSLNELKDSLQKEVDKTTKLQK